MLDEGGGAAGDVREIIKKYLIVQSTVATVGSVFDVSYELAEKYVGANQ